MTTPTARQFRAAADKARALDTFLSQAMRSKAMPLLIGFDLDYLAEKFDEAADQKESLRG